MGEWCQDQDYHLSNYLANESFITIGTIQDGGKLIIMDVTVKYMDDISQEIPIILPDPSADFVKLSGAYLWASEGPHYVHGRYRLVFLGCNEGIWAG